MLKDSDFDEVVSAIYAITANKMYISPAISDILISDYVHRLSKETQLEDSLLTAREREVLQLIAEGRQVSQIASQLNISVKTVEKHRHNIMEKLDIHNVAELTKYAVREGLTFLDF